MLKGSHVEVMLPMSTTLPMTGVPAIVAASQRAADFCRVASISVSLCRQLQCDYTVAGAGHTGNEAKIV